MGRTIIADETIQQTLKSLVQIPDCLIGLIIGQSSSQRDYVCHLASTLLNDEKDEDKKPQSKKKADASKKLVSIDEIDESLVTLHAKQVYRMLPGGITVLGVFTLYPGDSLPANSMSKVKQILISIFKVLNKQMQLPSMANDTEKIYLHINASSFKVVAKSFDLSNIHNSAKPADFRFQASCLSWHQLDCQFTLDFSIPIHKEHSRQPLLKQIYSNLIPFCAAVDSAIVLIDGQIPHSSDLLESKDTKRSGRQKEKKVENVLHAVQVFMEKFSNNKVDDVTMKECGALMDIKGALKSRAYVHSKATAEEAFSAIKQDIIRSLVSRLEIHCEDILLIEEEQHDPCTVHEPPRRVFAALPGNSVSVSDYLFPGEKPRDSLDAYNELLNLHLTEDKIEFDCEHVNKTNDLMSSPSEISKTVTTTTYEMLNVGSYSRSGNILVAALSLAILILATSLAHMFFREVG